MDGRNAIAPLVVVLVFLACVSEARVVALRSSKVVKPVVKGKVFSYRYKSQAAEEQRQPDEKSEKERWRSSKQVDYEVKLGKDEYDEMDDSGDNVRFYNRMRVNNLYPAEQVTIFVSPEYDENSIPPTVRMEFSQVVMGLKNDLEANASKKEDRIGHVHTKGSILKSFMEVFKKMKGGESGQGEEGAKKATVSQDTAGNPEYVSTYRPAKGRRAAARMASNPYSPPVKRHAQPQPQPSSPAPKGPEKGESSKDKGNQKGEEEGDGQPGEDDTQKDKNGRNPTSDKSTETDQPDQDGDSVEPGATKVTVKGLEHK